MKSMRRTDDDIVLSGVDAYPIADDHAERAAQEQPEPKRVTLPQPIRWRQSLQAGWSGERRMEFFMREMLLGIVICMAQIPESIAFAYLARVRPPVALHAAWVIGLICAVLGGRPGMINGATGAFAAIIATFLDEPTTEGGNGAGIETLFPSVMVAGVLMLLVWVHRRADRSGPCLLPGIGTQGQLAAGDRFGLRAPGFEMQLTSSCIVSFRPSSSTSSSRCCPCP